MRWNCPHCGTGLAIADDRITSGWSFSRCYKCAGHALIKRPEVNLIKVDHAPNGEHVLLPEANEQLLLSKSATQKIAQATQHQNLRRQEEAQKEAAADAIRNAMGNHSEESHSIVRPARQRRGNHTNWIASPAAGGGVHMRPANQNENPLDSHQSETAALLPNGDVAIQFPEPLDESKTKSFFRKYLPYGIGVAAITTLGSGFYLVVEGQKMVTQAKLSTVKERTSDRSEVIKSENNDQLITNQSIAQPAPSKNVAPQTTQNSAANASSQTSATPQLSSRATALTVKVKDAKTSVYSGPGYENEVVGTADPKMQYRVMDWHDQWFQIETSGKTAWIRNDRVQLISN
jgi:hypothetical protein